MWRQRTGGAYGSLSEAAEKGFVHTRPVPGAPRRALPELRSRLDKILNEDPAASRLGGVHTRGAPYSSHRAPQRLRLRFCLGLPRRPGRIAS
jgi:hypothetical protein